MRTLLSRPEPPARRRHDADARVAVGDEPGDHVRHRLELGMARREIEPLTEHRVDAQSRDRAPQLGVMLARGRHEDAVPRRPPCRAHPHQAIVGIVGPAAEHAPEAQVPARGDRLEEAFVRVPRRRHLRSPSG